MRLKAVHIILGIQPHTATVRFAQTLNVGARRNRDASPVLLFTESLRSAGQQSTSASTPKRTYAGQRLLASL
jgi:hypothetical protein